MHDDECRDMGLSDCIAADVPPVTESQPTSLTILHSSADNTANVVISPPSGLHMNFKLDLILRCCMNALRRGQTEGYSARGFGNATVHAAS